MGAPEAAVEAAFSYPSSWKASFLHWWNEDSAISRQSEVALLRRGLRGIPLTDARTTDDSSPPASAVSSETRSAVLRHVQLSGKKDRFLNVLEIGRGQRSDDEHVLLHAPGYGGGLAFSFQNLDAMSSVPGTRLFAMDWLGQGLSGRPKFPHIKPQGKGGAAVRSRVQQAENFSIDALEEWREKEGIKKMTLMCHSLGGYLSAAYALKYPDRVHKLILLSPVGVPEAPYELPDASEGDVLDEVGSAEIGKDFAHAASTIPGKEKEKAPSGLFATLWNANLSPFGLIRASSFLGPKFVSRYAAWRYSSFENEVQSELFTYLWTICRQRGSGEYTLGHVLAPGAYARWPLMQRLARWDKPVSIIYGDHDWMRPEHGESLVKMLKNRPPTAENELQRKHSRVVINPHSGHWVFLENPESFNSLVVKEIKMAVKDHPVTST